MTKYVNADYLCIIRENNGKTSFETIDIPSSNELISRLEGLLKNDNATVLDMQDQMDLTFRDGQRNKINYIFPQYYAESFVGIVEYPKALSFAEYNTEIESESNSLRKNFFERNEFLRKETPSQFQQELADHIKVRLSELKYIKKKHYLDDARRFISAYDYMRALNQVKKQGDVRMYSTATVGWSEFDYKVTDDVAIKVGTNFGYGQSSYFYLRMKYKNIDIIPYSFLVKYYYAKSCDLVRYTRLYYVASDSWNKAFSFVQEAANMASGSPEEFVRVWILNEVKDMICRLNGFLKGGDEYIMDFLNNNGKKVDCGYITVRNMSEEEKGSYAVYPEEMKMAIRAEKVTGALDFLNDLTRLSSIFPEIEESIANIKDIAVAIVPEIDAMAGKLNDDISRLQGKNAQLEDELAELRKRLEPYMKEIDDIYNKRDNTYMYWGYYADKYAESHKEYAELRERKTGVDRSISEVNEEIWMRKRFLCGLQSCRYKVSSASLVEEKAIAA